MGRTIRSRSREHRHGVMRTRLTPRPGQPGTLGLRKEHGNRLACVRHRYDEQACKRFKAAELIVESTDWDPHPKQDHEIVPVRVDWHKQELRDHVNRPAAGGTLSSVSGTFATTKSRVLAFSIASFGRANEKQAASGI